MKDTHLAEQDHCHATALSLGDLGTDLDEECFYVFPLDIRTFPVSKDGIECALVLPLHSENGTTSRYHQQGCGF